MRSTPDFDFGLTESAAMIREAAGRFADEQILPLAAEIDRNDRFPRELWEPMGALGLHGITVEEDLGGLGLGYLDHVIAVEEVSRASGAVGLSYGAHSNLCVNQIRRWGNDEQKAKYLPKLVSGEHVGALAMSEPGAGSDLASLQCKAEDMESHVEETVGGGEVGSGCFVDCYGSGCFYFGGWRRRGSASARTYRVVSTTTAIFTTATSGATARNV